ncbi:calmodulin calcium-dependent NAD kinase-like [Impatiens glandulifera]|uniref:calmodulin calcium-dependent NAD kinase-like n=1 Tax=Impatiens glandulifera TaxID=253017 RepID=UPI001FB0897E|nr:calmodulin calcium-dependent NAD kinase-like [Impatiens glandulifera]
MDLHNKFIPRTISSESGRIVKFERFSSYIARQIGIEDVNDCPQLCKLADEYLKKSKQTEQSIYEYFVNEKEAREHLYIKLIEEFDRCILSYFAFNWSQASYIINQVLMVDSQQKKLKDLILAATRKQRFDKVSKELKMTRIFSTLLEEMKAIGSIGGDEKCTNVMVPAAHNQRSPVLLLIGGGMGAGKSTVLKDILNEPFWSGVANTLVVVEADAFKQKDVIFQALKGHHNDMLHTSELVHQSSTDAASSLLVTALNEGRDVIMDSTLSWEPFVYQTIDMVRNVHKCRYRMGVGYKVEEDNTLTENYWEVEAAIELREDEPRRKPYRIELVGVICDVHLAVVRGIRRAIYSRRAVRVQSQLISHKRFASAFKGYCNLVDNARLYLTNSMVDPPNLIAWKEGNGKLLVEPEEIKYLNLVAVMNQDADSIDELYQEENTIMEEHSSIWKNIVLLPLRDTLQLELKLAIQKIEANSLNRK